MKKIFCMVFIIVFSFSSTAMAYNFGDTTLKNGSRGEAVMELQRFLNSHLNLGLVIDGKLGPKTIAVIRQWQKNNNLVADGLIGTKTKALMNSIAERWIPAPGSDRDIHGCIGSAGFQWCDIKQKCIRSWEESCSTSTTNSNSVNKPSLTLISPNGGEVFKGGDQVAIKWKSSNVSNISFAINLKYYDKDNNYITDQELAYFVPATDNEKIITIPTELKQVKNVYKVSKYKVSIGKVPSENNFPGDISDNFFTINRLPQIGTQYATPIGTSAELMCMYKYQYGTNNPEITFEYGENPCPLTSIDGSSTPSCTRLSKIMGTQTYSSEPEKDTTEKFFIATFNIQDLKPNTKYNYQCIVKNNTGQIVGFDKGSQTTYVDFTTAQ